jgi:antitoxin component of RelBE/YafQ-DinJ toxin-antitoxin module
MYNLVFVVSPKEKMINVRLTPAVHDQFKVACDLRGVSMSSLLHQFIVRTIREEKTLEPDAFEQKLEQARRARVVDLEDEIPEQTKGVRKTKR